MPKIPIKKRKQGWVDKEMAGQIKVDLRNKLKKEEARVKTRPWLIIIFVFVLVLAISLAWFFLSSQKQAFDELVPAQAVVFALIDYQALYDQASPWAGFLKENNVYGQTAVFKMKGYFNQVGLDFKEDFGSFFKKQAGFILMPSDTETSFPFVILLEKKIGLGNEAFNQGLEELEQNLEKDYSLSFNNYRQTKIVVLDSLRSLSPGSPEFYAYTQIEDYFIISNSQKALKQIIDLVIEN